MKSIEFLGCMAIGNKIYEAFGVSWTGLLAAITVVAVCGLVDSVREARA